MSSSTWRVLSGYATYQRTPIKMTSGGKWAPLKLIAIAASLMMYRCSQGRIIPQSASNKKCDTTRSGSGSTGPGRQARSNDEESDGAPWAAPAGDDGAVC